MAGLAETAKIVKVLNVIVLTAIVSVDSLSKKRECVCHSTNGFTSASNTSALEDLHLSINGFVTAVSTYRSPKCSPSLSTSSTISGTSTILDDGKAGA
jgi:hypothetical protein